MSPTRQLAFDLLLLALYGSAFTFVLAAAWRMRGGRARLGATLATAVGGLVLLVLLLALWGREAGDVLGRLDGNSYPETIRDPVVLTWAAALAALVGGFIAADFVLHRLIPWIEAAGTLLPPNLRDPLGSDSRLAGIVVAPLFAVGIAASLVGLAVLDKPPDPPPLQARSLVEVEARFNLQTWPLGGVMASDTVGYLTLYPDKIVRFELPEGSGDLKLETVADGLDFPRGLAILDDTLYVTEIGKLLCDDPRLTWCPPPEDGGRRALEIETLRITRGRVLAFQILDGGRLASKRVVLSDLPVVNYEHSLNAITVGPDGRLYATVAGLAVLGAEPAILEQIQRPNLDLLGTVLAFNPDGSGLEVFARGLRNPYDLVWSPDGRLYTADNDGVSAGGWRAEEVLWVQQGADYGFPLGGTFDAASSRTHGPIWIRARVASVGVEWAGEVGLGPGLIIGGEFSLDLLPLELPEDGSPPYVKQRAATRSLLTPNGFPTVVQSLAGNRLLLAIVALNPWESEVLILSILDPGP